MTAIVTNRPAVTFNAAGVNPATVAPYGKDLSSANLLINAYRVRGELLTTLQDGVFSFMPGSVGWPNWLPASSSNALSRHSMVEVLEGMRKMGAM